MPFSGPTKVSAGTIHRDRHRIRAVAQQRLRPAGVVGYRRCRGISRRSTHSTSSAAPSRRRRSAVRPAVDARQGRAADAAWSTRWRSRCPQSRPVLRRGDRDGREPGRPITDGLYGPERVNVADQRHNHQSFWWFIRDLRAGQLRRSHSRQSGASDGLPTAMPTWRRPRRIVGCCAGPEPRSAMASSPEVMFGRGRVATRRAGRLELEHACRV